MSNSTSSSKAAALARVQALIAGTQKRFPNASFTLGNTVFTTASLVQLLGSLPVAILALNAAQASAKDAVTNLQAVEAKVNPVIRALRRFILAAFANATQELSDFGMTPPKAPTPLTAEQKAASAAKARATRAARGTASKKSKLAVKGDVVGVTVTPIISSKAAPATPATPTPSPSPQPASVLAAPTPSGGSAPKA